MLIFRTLELVLDIPLTKLTREGVVVLPRVHESAVFRLRRSILGDQGSRAHSRSDRSCEDPRREPV